MSRQSLPSLQTSARVFECTTTETLLTQCLGERAGNATCRHLLVTCSTDGVAATWPPPSGTATDSDGSSEELNSGRPTKDSSAASAFPVVGAVVGIVTALVLVGVVMGVGVVVGAVLWRRKKTKSITLHHDPDSYVRKNFYFMVMVLHIHCTVL